MLKLSLVAMFVLSLATLSFASALMPMPAGQDIVSLEATVEAPYVLSALEAQPRAWIQTFE